MNFLPQAWSENRTGLRIGRWICLIAATSLFFSCFKNNDLDPQEGPSTETNGLSGSVITSEGSPAIGAKVIVRPTDYLQDTLESSSVRRPGGETTTDAQGKFSLPDLPPGSYAVEIRSSSESSALIRCSLANTDPPRLVVPTTTLKPTAVLRGRVLHPRVPDAAVFIQVYGLDHLLLVPEGDGKFVLSGLPAGSHRLRLFSSDPAVGARDLPAVTLQAGDTLDLGATVLDAFAAEDYSTWPSSRTLKIRTGTSGAGITGTVTDFPLLIRLDSTNFPFDSAASNGADIRFSSGNGKHLDFEIESWSPLTRSAAVWVKVDSIRGNDDSQAIHLYFGKSGALPHSSGYAVFDTAQGFESVWHMGNPAAGTTRLLDASPTGNRLITASLATPSPVAGPTPGTTGFDGTASFLYAEQTGSGLQTLSLSLWMRPTGEGKVIGFENYPDTLLSCYDRHLWVTADGSIHFGIFIKDPPEVALAYRRIISSPPGLMDGKWHMVTATQSPTGGQALFVDGLLTASDSTVVHAAAFTGRWVLGNGILTGWDPTPANLHYQGGVDEVRITHIVHDTNRIKLDYETQKPGSKVIAILP